VVEDVELVELVDIKVEFLDYSDAFGLGWLYLQKFSSGLSLPEFIDLSRKLHQ